MTVDISLVLKILGTTELLVPFPTKGHETQLLRNRQCIPLCFKAQKKKKVIKNYSWEFPGGLMVKDLVLLLLWLRPLLRYGFDL